MHDITSCMDFLQTRYDFSCIKSSSVFLQDSFFLDQAFQGAFGTMLKNKVKLMFILESSEELDNSWMSTKLIKDILLPVNTFGFVILDNVLLVKSFDG